MALTTSRLTSTPRSASASSSRNQTQSSFVYYADGKTQIGQYATQNRQIIPLSEMPANLTNADLSSGPYHNTFSNTGTLPILAVDSGQRAVILGASGGTVTNPDPVGVPDGGSLLAVYLGIAGMMLGFRRHFVKRAA